jgi:hypothetical protein
MARLVEVRMYSLNPNKHRVVSSLDFPETFKILVKKLFLPLLAFPPKPYRALHQLGF